MRTGSSKDAGELELVSELSPDHPTCDPPQGMSAEGPFAGGTSCDGLCWWIEVYEARLDAEGCDSGDFPLALELPCVEDSSSGGLLSRGLLRVGVGSSGPLNSPAAYRLLSTFLGASQ